MNNILLIVISSLSMFSGNDVRIKTEISKTTMTIGEALVYTIRMEYPEKTKFIGEPVTDFSNFEITRIQEYDPVKQNGNVSRRTEYILTTFNIDTFLIRGPILRFMSNGDTMQVQGESKMVIVTSVLDSAAADIRPEKPNIEGEINWFGLIVTGIGILLVLGVIIFFLLRWYRCYLKNKLLRQEAAPEVIKTPEEWAMERLISLKKSKMPEREDFKLFHIEISNIIRMYIEKITPVQAMELPTSDLMTALRKKSVLPESYQQLLRVFLEVCDLVKFAKYQSTSAECDELYEQAADIITRGAAFHKAKNEPNREDAS